MAEATKPDAAARKLAGEIKQDFDLHVLLIVKQEKLVKSKALVLAYSEGKSGLSARLHPKQ